MDKQCLYLLVVLVCVAECYCLLVDDKLSTSTGPKCRGYEKIRLKNLSETARNGTVPVARRPHTFRSSENGKPVRVSYAVIGTGFWSFSVTRAKVKMENVKMLTVKFSSDRTLVIQQYSNPSNDTTWTFILPQPSGFAGKPVLRFLLRAVPEEDAKAEMKVIQVMGCRGGRVYPHQKMAVDTDEDIDGSDAEDDYDDYDGENED